MAVAGAPASVADAQVRVVEIARDPVDWSTGDPPADLSRFFIGLPVDRYPYNPLDESAYYRPEPGAFRRPRDRELFPTKSPLEDVIAGRARVPVADLRAAGFAHPSRRHQTARELRALGYERVRVINQVWEWVRT